MKFLMQTATLTLLICHASYSFAENVHGVLRVVKGDVQIKSGKTGELARARIGEQVFPKDVVITGKDARAKIVMIDNNEINISPESQIEIQHYEFDPSAGKKDVLLNVLYGKVRSKVEQHYDGRTSKFQVKTPAAVAGVRGTDFMTSYDRASRNSQVVTFRGAVEFGLPGPGGSISNAVSVTPGKLALSTSGAPPAAPITMPKDQLAKVDNDSRADTTAPAPSKGAAPSADKPATKAPASGDNGAASGSSANGNGGSAQNGPQSSASSGDSRNPASTGPGPSSGLASPPSAVGPSATSGSMFKPEDFAGSGALPPPVAAPLVPNIIPSVQPINNLPQCTTCNQFIQGGNTKLNVQIK